ncbi:hypothetical protein [Symbiopectobacterium purcellii]|uniref:CMD domain protein n=1 Tax=Symbiopectobacterium purcellii TaxID=2871826 RepID=A0ABX9AX51_9ENTR|nr:hypothetical protein [Symbiopectobacterium purcellii]QZN97520.1 hypothetical protein K6K13_09445 [Symbiopectobacterium purcellii]
MLRHSNITLQESENDLINQMAGIDAGSTRDRLRRLRPDYVSGVEACRCSVLTPHDDQGLPAALRALLALRMARTLGVSAQVAFYQRLVDSLPSSQTDLALNADGKQGTRAFQALVYHCDVVTNNPAASSQQDLEHLQQAGWTTPQIIALSELIAFINFESRLVVGLSALGEGQ